MHTFSALTALVFGALGAATLRAQRSERSLGTASDFLRFLAQIEPGRTTKTGERSVGLLQRDLLRGRILLEKSGSARSVSFAPDGFTQVYPIESVATSTAEIAPLLLYLRHVAMSSDMIFIDEPEAHFHPANQVQLART
jgi:predicted ATPase